jgi:hypothetical protein
MINIMSQAVNGLVAVWGHIFPSCNEHVFTFKPDNNTITMASIEQLSNKYITIANNMDVKININDSNDKFITYLLPQTSITLIANRMLETPAIISRSNLTDTKNENNTWVTNGNKNMGKDRRLGTLDDENFFLISNGEGVATVAKESLNLYKPLLCGNTDLLSARICIKQTGQISNDAPNSTHGLKFQDAFSTDGFYLGFNVSNALGFYSYGTGRPYFKMVEFAPLVSSFYTQIQMKNNIISDLKDPRDPQDAATKNYVDLKYSKQIGFISTTSGTGGVISLSSPLTATTKIIMQVFFPNKSSDSYNGNTGYLTAANYPCIGYGPPTFVGYGYNINANNVNQIPTIQLIFREFNIGEKKATFDAKYYPSIGGSEAGQPSGFSFALFQ